MSRLFAINLAGGAWLPIPRGCKRLVKQAERLLVVPDVGDPLTLQVSRRIVLDRTARPNVPGLVAYTIPPATACRRPLYEQVMWIRPEVQPRRARRTTHAA